MTTIRPMQANDCDSLARLRHALWPDDSVAGHEKELLMIVDGGWSAIYPYAIFVATGEDDVPVGFAEVTLRSRADGCDPLQPVGYLEGWYVAESHRGTGVGRDLLRRAEQWAREQGCSEMASDTWLDNELSQRVHEALGFEVVDRVVHFKKAL